MAPRTASLAVALALALALAPAAARAQARDPAAAEGLFQAGKSEMEAGRLDQACALFRQSREADGAPGTTFHLADCEEKRGKLATAWALFVEAAQRLPAGDARISVVRARAAALEPRLSHLAIDVARDVPRAAPRSTAMGCRSAWRPAPSCPSTPDDTWWWCARPNTPTAPSRWCWWSASAGACR